MTTPTRTVLLIASFFTLPAAAWDLPCNWITDTTTLNNKPGGGGVFGTGGKRDYSVTCTHCHQKTLTEAPAGLIGASVTFNPPLGTAGTATTYVAGQRYAVTVQLTGQYLGLANCGAALHINSFAATFEDAQGNVAGLIESTTGQSSTACLTNLTSTNCQGGLPMDGGTFIAGDCHAVAGYGENRATWSFFWTPPPVGMSPVTMYYGVVDGDCVMDSLGDDVKTGTLVIQNAGSIAPRPPRRQQWALLALTLVGAAAVLSARRSRSGV